MDGYIKGALLGQGTFGKVHQYTSKKLGIVVAIKKIHLQEAKEGVNMTALREIKLLRELHHPRLVQLFDVFSHKANLFLVFEYCESDLEQLINDKRTLLSGGDVKAYMHMILTSLDFCHRNWVLHRDIKPNNFLITKQGDLKLGDFGLARIYGSPDRRLTSQVFALWYRAPELLFGSFCYGPGVDVWAAGCIFAELMLRRPWFQAQTPQGLHSAPTEIGTLREIFGALGTPTPEAWPDADTLPNYMRFSACPGQPLRATFTQASEDALELLAQMVAFDPRKRITAGQALQHRYFACDPPQTPVEKLPRAPVRASNPLVMEAQGGSALQKAPGELPQRPGSLLDAAKLLSKQPSPSPREAEGGDRESSGAQAGSGQPAGWGTISKLSNDRPPIADKDLRALRKRKFDLTAATSPVALSPA